MSYRVINRKNQIVLENATLEEARKEVIDLINKRQDRQATKDNKNRQVRATITPFFNYDEDGGLLEELRIINHEDIDKRVIFAAIKHDSVLEE